MEEELNNKFSAEYIRKYLDGQLSDQEMQSLEKAALEDPFLADAIEGFEESRKHTVSFESGIADLKTRLRERVRQRNRKTGILYQLSKWPVAASFILVIGLTFFAVIYINKRPDISQRIVTPDTSTTAVIKPLPENIKQSDSLKADEPTIASAKPLKDDKLFFNKKEKDLTQNAEGYSSEQNEDKSSSVKKAGKPLATVPSKDRSNGSVHADSSVHDNSSVYDNSSVDADRSDRVDSSVRADSSVYAYRRRETEKSNALAKKDINAPLAASKEGLTVERFSDPDLKSIAGPSGNYIKGVVVDEKGMPIPFAEVNIKGTNRHVFTDTSGFFKLYMKDPRLAALVFAQPNEYGSVSAELKPDSNVTNTIRLGPSSAVLNETTLLKYDQPPSVTGWDVFYNYIDSNKKINTADSVLKGDEVISFLLYPDGKLSSFKIEKSVSPAHDAEILRLIQTAPKLKSQKKKRYSVQIHFK